MLLVLSVLCPLFACTGGASRRGAGDQGVTPSAKGASVTDAGRPSESGALPCQRLRSDLHWHGQNRARLQAFMDARGRCGMDALEKAPIAVFDWDNTVVKNDVGDATLYYLLAKDGLLAPRDFGTISPYLTPRAAEALKAACGNLAKPGHPLPTSRHVACADEILSIYSGGKTVGGKTVGGKTVGGKTVGGKTVGGKTVGGKTVAGALAFSGHHHRRMEPSYALLAQLLAGHGPEDVRGLARKALTESLAMPKGATQRVGSQGGLPHWVRIYPEMRDLMETLSDHGFVVWIVSASPQPVVEVWAEEVGVPAARVIGVRNLVGEDGRLTPHLAGCGEVPDGALLPGGRRVGDSLIPFMEGKRCFINRVIFGDRSPQAALRQSDPRKRLAFAAGDSDTDVSFLEDATGLSLVINRNQPEVMCHAYWDVGGGGKWLVNPMFIAPLPELPGGYPCEARGCRDPSGARVPCRDEMGQPIPHQRDRVF